MKYALYAHAVAKNARGRVVGLFVRDSGGSWWLEKRALDPAVHMLRHPCGWATDVEHIEELRRRGGPTAGVRIFDTNHRIWTATVAQFDMYGVPVERGHGTQVVLPERFWHIDAPGARQLPLFNPCES